MSKKLFNELIKRASRSVPKEQDKQLRPENYTEKQTYSHKSVDTSAKPNDKSRQ